MIKMSFQTNGTGTQTHDLQIASLIPQPLDQGSHHPSSSGFRYTFLLFNLPSHIFPTIDDSSLTVPKINIWGTYQVAGNVFPLNVEGNGPFQVPIVTFIGAQHFCIE